MENQKGRCQEDADTGLRPAVLSQCATDTRAGKLSGRGPRSEVVSTRGPGRTSPVAIVTAEEAPASPIIDALVEYTETMCCSRPSVGSMVAKQTTGEHREAVACQVVGGGDSNHGEDSDGQGVIAALLKPRGVHWPPPGGWLLPARAWAHRLSTPQPTPGPSKTGEHRGERERGRLPGAAHLDGSFVLDGIDLFLPGFGHSPSIVERFFFLVNRRRGVLRFLQLLLFFLGALPVAA